MKSKKKSVAKKVSLKKKPASKELKKSSQSKNDEMVYVRPARESLTKVSPFRVAKHLVTFGEWNEVVQKAKKKGYSLASFYLNSESPEELEKFDKQACYNMTFREVAKWCNFKSQSEGLEPCYQFNGKVFKSGELRTSKDFLDWDRSANGYRVATKKEWWHASLDCRAKVISKNPIRKAKGSEPNSLGIFDIGAGAVTEFVCALRLYPQGPKEFTAIMNCPLGSLHKTTVLPVLRTGFRLVRNAT